MIFYNEKTDEYLCEYCYKEAQEKEDEVWEDDV